MTGMNGILAGGSSGEVALPGDAEGSLLYLLTARLEEPHMPPRGEKIEQASLDLIKKWINQGLLPTASGKPMEKKKASINFSLASITLGKPKGAPPMPKYLSKEPVLVTSRSFAPASMAKAPWSPLVAIAGQKQVLLYHTETLELLGVLPFPEGFVESLNFSKNGSLLLAGGGRGGKSGRVVGWEVETGKRILTLGEEQDSILTADISPDQSLVATGGPSKVVKVFDLSSGEILYQIEKHSEWVTQVSISPDGILLATADRNGGLFVWETKTGNPFYSLDGHKEAITSLSWRIDSNMLISASEEGTIRTWEMQNGKQVKSWNAHSEGVLSVDFDINANVVSAGRDQQTIIWDLDGKEKMVFSKFQDMVVETCFSYDGERVIAADWTGEISVWDSKTGKKTGSLSGNPSTIEQNRLRCLESLKKSEVDFSKAESLHHSLSAEFSCLKLNRDELKKRLEHAQKAAVDSRQAMELARSAYEEMISKRANVHECMQQKYSQSKAKNLELKKAKTKKERQSLELLTLEKQISSFNTEPVKLNDAHSQPTNSGNKNAGQSKFSTEVPKGKKNFVSNRSILSEAKNRLSTTKADFKKTSTNYDSLVNAAKLAKKNFEKAKAELDALDSDIENKKKRLDDAVALTNKRAEELMEISSQVEIAEKKFISCGEKLTASSSELSECKLKLGKARTASSIWQAELINLERHRELAKLRELKNELATLDDHQLAALQPKIDQVSKKTDDLFKSYLEALPK